ncbi:MAG TPA: hypothetical protein VHL78_09905 [Actinomycetota bacterium]|nr:hypothetical protein [Actinomycetota bacterium]
MTSIRTNCPRCGEVEMEASLVLLTVEAGSGEGVYSFVCPVCEDLVQKTADHKIVELLRTAGVETAVASAEMARAKAAHPSGAPGPREAADLPPLTFDDLIDFHFALQRDDWMGELLAGAE